MDRQIRISSWGEQSTRVSPIQPQCWIIRGVNQYKNTSAFQTKKRRSLNVAKLFTYPFSWRILRFILNQIKIGIFLMKLEIIEIYQRYNYSHLYCKLYKIRWLTSFKKHLIVSKLQNKNKVSRTHYLQARDNFPDQLIRRKISKRHVLGLIFCGLIILINILKFMHYFRCNIILDEIFCQLNIKLWKIISGHCFKPSLVVIYVGMVKYICIGKFFIVKN